METITEIHNWTQCRDEWIVGEYSSHGHGPYIYGSGNTMEGGAERVQETEYWEIYCETVFSRKGCINRGGTNQGHINMEGENAMRSHSWTKNYRQLMIAGRRTIKFQGWALLLVAGPETIYTYKQQNRFSRLCLYICAHTYIHVYIHIYVATIIKEKEDIDFKVGEYWRGWRWVSVRGTEKKGKRETDVILFQLKTSFFKNPHKIFCSSV